jgi:hypothetical protein
MHPVRRLIHPTRPDQQNSYVQTTEQCTTAGDLMYMHHLEFVKLGVGMLLLMDDYTSLEGVSPTTVEGVHSCGK